MNKNKFYILHKNCLDFSLTLDCGQSFRWRKIEDGTIHGVAFGKAVTIEDKGDEAVLYGTDEKEFNEIWRSYFDIDRDYEKICEKLSCDEYLAKAIKEYPGIRILRQDPWETLCSFIISQNNNIPRIKGIIDRLCRSLGDNLGDEDYSFPVPEKILEAGAEGLAPLRAGFRTKYILDAAEKISKGEIDFEKIDTGSIEMGAEELKKIKGVGYKVAACTLLYGFGKVDALPVDVWVKRILAEMYPNGMPECTIGVRGIAQQYLFHWRRNL